MKKSIFILIFIFLFVLNSKSQDRNQASVNISYNQIELAYKHKFIPNRIWGEVYIGTGNQDINSRFDDILAGIRIGYPVLTTDKSTIDLATCFGAYLPRNDYYGATTPVFGAGMKYSGFIGKTKKHCLSLSAGYQYGKQDYKQEYASDKIYTATVGTFRIPSFSLLIGYGFNF